MKGHSELSHNPSLKRLRVQQICHCLQHSRSEPMNAGLIQTNFFSLGAQWPSTENFRGTTRKFRSTHCKSTY